MLSFTVVRVIFDFRHICLVCDRQKVSKLEHLVELKDKSKHISEKGVLFLENDEDLSQVTKIFRFDCHFLIALSFCDNFSTFLRVISQK